VGKGFRKQELDLHAKEARIAKMKTKKRLQPKLDNNLILTTMRIFTNYLALWFHDLMREIG